MQNGQSVSVFELIQCLANIITCVGVFLAAFEFVKSYRYKVKIQYTVGSIGMLNYDNTVDSNYGFIIESINKSVFDISVNSVSLRFGKKGSASIGEFTGGSSYTIKARNNHNTFLPINDGIIENVIKENNIDPENRIYIIIETPIKKYTKRTSYKVRTVIEKYHYDIKESENGKQEKNPKTDTKNT